MSDISVATLTATQRIFYNWFPRLRRFIKRQKQISREFACGRCASIQSNASTGSSPHEQITAEDPRATVKHLIWRGIQRIFGPKASPMLVFDTNIFLKQLSTFNGYCAVAD